MESPIGSAETSTHVRARIIRAENLGIQFIDFAEIRNVGQKNRRLEHVARVCAQFGEHGLDVFKRLLRLSQRTALRRFARLRVHADHTAHEDHSAVNRRRAIRPNRRRALLRLKTNLFHSFFLPVVCIPACALSAHFMPLSPPRFSAAALSFSAERRHRQSALWRRRYPRKPRERFPHFHPRDSPSRDSPALPR